MKKTTFLKTMLLLCALIVGSSSAWAEDVTYKLTIDASFFNTTSYAANNNEKTTDAVCTTDDTKTFEVKWTSNQVMKSGEDMQWQKSKGVIYNSTNLGTITAVDITSSAGSFTTYYGTTAQPTSNTTVGDGFFQILVGNATGKTSKVEITFTISDGGSSNLTTNDLALTGAPIDLSFDLYNNNNAQVINYTTSSTGAVTVSESEYVTTTVNEATKTITVTPVKVTATAQTITISQASDNTYAASSVTFTVTIDDSTPDTYVWSEASLSNLTSEDVFVIVGNDGDADYAMSNDNGTGGAPTAVAVTISNGAISGKVDDNIKWQLSGNSTDGYTFYPNGTTETWLYCNTTASSSSNNNIRVGTGDRKAFELTNDNYLVTKDDKTARYASVYSGTDWRGYTNTTTAPTTVKFYKRGTGVVTEVAAPTFSPEAGTYTSAQNVTISCATEGATIYYTIDGSQPTNESTVYSKAIPVATTTTIKAKAFKEGLDASAIASATYTIVVIEHAGTEADPYTIADARNAIDLGEGITDVCVKGIVSQVDSYNDNYKSITYWISDDGSKTDQLEVYSGKGLGGADFASVNDILVGDVVVVSGTLKKYGSTYEFDKNNQLVSLTRSAVPSITVNTASLNVDAEEHEGTIEVTYTNITDIQAEVQFVDADGTTPATYNWLAAEIDAITKNIDYVISENTTEAARTAYLKVYALGDEAQDVYSELITITQAKPVIKFATLPFEFNGGRADIAEINGLTHSGLGNDYNTAPKLRFDNTDDNLILQINEEPGALTFDIKGNTFSDGTFTVQTSADGVNYTDLATYTELGSTQSELFNLASDVRFIKWIYTEKVNGNVALGNIKLIKSFAAKISDAQYATFCSSRSLDFSGTGITAYTAKANGNAVLLTQIAKVPANTPVVLYKDDAGIVEVPTATSTDNVGENDLIAGPVTGDGASHYVLGKNNEGTIGFGILAADAKLPGTKAYIPASKFASSNEASFFEIIFSDATSISEMKTSKVNGDIYDLQGRKVANPTKGLYIVNGKKVAIK